MASIPYLDRLNQLEEQSVISRNGGLPLNRPQSEEQKDMLGIPQEPEPQEDPMEKAMQTQFGMNLQNFSKQDARFQDMMGEYQKLAMGLKQQVDSGYMPLPIAQQKLKEFLSDSGHYFNTHEAGPMDNPENKAMLEGILSQAMGGGQQPSPDMMGGDPNVQPVQ